MPAHSIAIQLGDARLVNVTMLGALLQVCGLLSLAAVEEALRKQLPVRHRHLLPANISALYAGAEWGAEARDVAGSLSGERSPHGHIAD